MDRNNICSNAGTVVKTKLIKPAKRLKPNKIQNQLSENRANEATIK